MKVAASSTSILPDVLAEQKSARIFTRNLISFTGELSLACRSLRGISSPSKKKTKRKKHRKKRKKQKEKHTKKSRKQEKNKNSSVKGKRKEKKERRNNKRHGLALLRIHSLRSPYVASGGYLQFCEFAESRPVKIQSRLGRQAGRA